MHLAFLDQELEVLFLSLSLSVFLLLPRFIFWVFYQVYDIIVY